MASVVALARLLGDPTLELVATAPVTPPLRSLDRLPDHVVEQALWWEQHLMEVLTGLPPDPAPGAVMRPEYDLRRRSLRERELAKLDELHRLGHRVGLTTLKRQRRNYERDGIWGLVDHRATRQRSAAGRVDDRVVAAVRQAIGEETDRSTGTVTRLRRRVEQLLTAEYGTDAPPVPAERTFYRLVQRISSGKHTFGSARTRRSLAKQPEGPFGSVTAARPGELMQIDSTPLDVRVVLDGGLVDRVELTGLVDLATRTAAAVVLRPSTKSVDVALLLARALTPEPMRPGWTEALRMSRSVLPHRSLTSVDQRLADAAARPVIAPETIVFDHGKVFLSQNFRSAARALGISLQPAHLDTPTDKPVVERTLGSVGTLFAQHVAGYVGSSIERRGRKAEQDAAWSMIELQALLDEWVVTVWQNRPHEGLRDPLTPDKALTPNEKYAALVATAGYVAVPLSAEDYIELLPATWRTINSYGIRIARRTYDAKALNPFRRQHSGVEHHNGRWEVHYDPYDVSRVWVRNHHKGGWITVTWTHLRTTPVPFGDLAWQHAREILAERGNNQATENEIARAAADLLNRAGTGPTTTPAASKRARRVAGRTKATTGDRPIPPAEDTAPADTSDEDTGEPIAKVISLGIYDPFEEAKKRW
ncbi:Mu transposase C-terminal domain-containing protein [Nocardia sp. NPDC052278]|uniref:Mu transposase C-terminal domain-containing protein n=1 Tax=unclassified Nocardia TaxID=2637762 RepID=UPI00367D231E